MAPALSRSLGASSVSALRPSPSSRSLPRAALVPRGRAAAARGVRWEAGRRRIVRVRCDAAVAEKPTEEETAGEKFEYQAEVSRLMDLIVHSLYSHKEVFLRELVSNASDALDKLRFLSVTDPSVLADGGELEIRIKPDQDAGTITITDTGIGMTKDELKDCLGTIAQSGTSKFLKALKENKDLGADNGLIGQFGVGFYSAFLVAEKVVVSTKSPKADKQYVWEAEADSSSYVIKEETDPEKMLTRGTQITLYLRDDDKYEFADPARIQGLVKNYSQFVSFPIYTWQEKSRTVEVEEEEESKEGEETTEGEKQKKKKTITEKYWDWELANEMKPIWMRNPKEIEKTEYNEFYKKTFNEFLDPLSYTHFTTEGEVEFRSVLYVPGMAPLSNEEIMNPKTKNIRLYVKRVFISDDFDGELFPRYLSFVKGVVDSNDLPLNVSREILQESRIVRIMRKRLVRKTFDMIEEITEKDDKEDYKKFWESFGKFMKLGCIEDTGNHKRLAPLLRFYSSKNETDLISLDQYVENMPETQKAIYYIATDSLQSAKTAPFLEKLVQKDIEVLYLVEPIDEVAIQNLQTYKEKKFVDISKEDLELGDEEEDGGSKNLDELDVVDGDGHVNGTILDGSGLGFVAVVAVSAEEMPDDKDDAGDVEPAEGDDVAGASEQDSEEPLTETQEEVVAVAEEVGDEVADGEEENDAMGLSLGFNSNGYDSMDVEEEAHIENLDEGDSDNEEAEESEDDGFEGVNGGQDMSWRIEDGSGDGNEDEEMTHSLQRCNTFGGMEFENLNKGDAEMRDELGFDDFSGRGSLERMTSSNLLQAMNSIPSSYNITENVHGLSGEFLSMGADAHKSGVDLEPGSSYLFGNNGKRHIGDIDGYNGNMQAQEQFPQCNQQKRMRHSNSSSVSPGSGFFNANFSVPIQNLMAEASRLYEQKEQELQNLQFEKQHWSDMLQQKDAVLQTLNATRFEQQNKYQAELRRFEHDLNVMGQLVTGYKKALKQTQASFEEYRKKFPCNKPLYGDVTGGGGLVLSVSELERMRFEEERQKLAAANAMIEKFQNEWLLKLDEWTLSVNSLYSRMEGLYKEIDLLKEYRRARFATPSTEE